MKIAQVAPLYESVPPKMYGGTERVVSYLTEELVRQGHTVTLFASGDSETSAKLVPACPRALWHDPDCKEALPHHVRMLELVLRDASRFDIIHFHCDYIHFPLVRRSDMATVTTLHGNLHNHDVGPFLSEYGDIPLVSVSDSQRRPVPYANWYATVYHGMPADVHKFGDGKGGYLAFLGRMSPEKRVDRAIEIARRSGMKLKIAARVYPEERQNFRDLILPMLRDAGPSVDYLGELGGADKDRFLRDAHALLFPIDWPEPFGLVMIEAFACGTPVIAWRNGSIPEVVEDGVTGFIVESIEEAAEKVGRVRELSRVVCRQRFEQRFVVERMAADYLEVYRRLASASALEKLSASAV